MAYQYGVAAPLVPAAPKKEHRTCQLGGPQPGTWQCTPGGMGRGCVEEEGEGDRNVVAAHKTVSKFRYKQSMFLEDGCEATQPIVEIMD